MWHNELTITGSSTVLQIVDNTRFSVAFFPTSAFLTPIFNYFLLAFEPADCGVQEIEYWEWISDVSVSLGSAYPAI